jgi:two-component system, NtrC family, response regulator AtoC
MVQTKKVLVVDDEAPMRKNISDLLSRDGITSLEASDNDEAFKQLTTNNPDLILLDINLPRIEGLNILKDIKKQYPDIPVIIFTAYGTSERAIEAMKSGAFDYLEKPFDLDEFLLTIRRALHYSELLKEVNQLKSRISLEGVSPSVDQLIGRNVKMQEIFKIIGRVAPTDASVLIQGESGTGKELVADAIQRHSLRWDKPFIRVNCGAFPETLLESEIFGHEKGAFTGAIAQRQGRFELANGGTMFLDEINNMPNSLQIKLLRVLQHHTFERVGGKETLSVDVRVIAATNKDIEQEVKAGHFREDLYYRLNVVRINVLPLRERPEDISLLVEHFLKKYSPNQNIIISPESIKKLQSYQWPGNIRELENVIQSSLVMSRGNFITIDHLPVTVQSEKELDEASPSDNQDFSLKKTLSNIEKNLILKALRKANWNRSQAATLLKIHRRFLYSKMKEYKITSDDIAN